MLHRGDCIGKEHVVFKRFHVLDSLNTVSNEGL